MIKIAVFLILLFFTIDIQAQTLIATSACPNSTANHNQRKIVRDTLQNIYVVFTDSINQETVINGVFLDHSTGLWSNPVSIINGNNPTLAITKNGRIHLVFESNDTLPEIRHISSLDFLTWSPVTTISDSLVYSTMPVADIDSAGKLNVFWKQNNGILNVSLIYACLNGDTLIDRKCITTKNEINDIAIANHLLYFENDLFFAIQFNNDSVQYFRSVDNMNNYNLIFDTTGASQPCISYNSFMEYQDNGTIRLLYINENSQLIEVESDPYLNYQYFYSHIIQASVIDNICIDDVAPPIGYSYLFMKNGNLYHGFSYGDLYWSIILDTISSNPINPSIAYKTFNFSFVDYIWMEDNGAGYNIFYKRDAKHIWVGLEDKEQGKGFTITGYPNPFSEQISIKVSVIDKKVQPLIEIYNTRSQLIKVLSAESGSENEYSYKWNGTDQNGNKVNPGTYLIMCTVGDKKTVRKVLYINK